MRSCADEDQERVAIADWAEAAMWSASSFITGREQGRCTSPRSPSFLGKRASAALIDHASLQLRRQVADFFLNCRELPLQD